MSLRQSAWVSEPKYKIDISQINSKLSIKVENQLLVQSTQVLILHEQDHAPTYYFPRDDVKLILFRKTNKVTFCPYKGDAQHWSLKIKNIDIAVAAWSYLNPFDEVCAIKNFIAFYPELSTYITLE